MYLNKFDGFTTRGHADFQDNRGIDEDSEFREFNFDISVRLGLPFTPTHKNG